MTLNLGRRTVLLMLLGAMDITYGSALLVANASGSTNRWWTTARWWPAAQGELWQIDIRWWGLVWVCVGCALLSAGFFRGDRHLFAMEMMLKSVWGFGALAWAVTTSSPGLWGPAATYIGLSLVVLLAAGWAEAPPLINLPAPSVLPDDDGGEEVH